MDWLTICADGATEDCVGQIQAVYLVALLVGLAVLALIARRTRDLTTAVLSLMAGAIAINIAIGSLTAALRLPIYLDSVGTVPVGALPGPWAGARDTRGCRQRSPRGRPLWVQRAAGRKPRCGNGGAAGDSGETGPAARATATRGPATTRERNMDASADIQRAYHSKGSGLITDHDPTG